MIVCKGRRPFGNFAITILVAIRICRQLSKTNVLVLYYLDNRLKANAIVRIVNIKLEDYVYRHALHTVMK